MTQDTLFTKPERCCERDTDGDGNCDIHISKGVLRKQEVTPDDIDLSNRLCSTFGKAEIEEAACHLIEYLQECQNGWSFKFAGLYEFYKRKGLNTDEMLFGLMGPWFDDGPMRFQNDCFYIANWGSGLQVTQDFLKRVSRHAR